MAKQITTIDKLAELTQHEFLAMNGRMDSMDSRMDRTDRQIDGGFKAVVDVLDVMRADLHDIKIALGPLVRSVVALEEDVRSLGRRVLRLEEKTGLKR